MTKFYCPNKSIFPTLAKTIICFICWSSLFNKIVNSGNLEYNGDILIVKMDSVLKKYSHFANFILHNDDWYDIF